jgi:hypothetical protein
MTTVRSLALHTVTCDRTCVSACRGLAARQLLAPQGARSGGYVGKGRLARCCSSHCTVHFTPAMHAAYLRSTLRKRVGGNVFRGRHGRVDEGARADQEGTGGGGGAQAGTFPTSCLRAWARRPRRLSRPPPPRAGPRGPGAETRGGGGPAPPPPSLAHASSARNQAEEETAELAEKHAVLATGNPLVAGGGSFNIKRRCARAQGSAEGTTAAAQNA